MQTVPYNREKAVTYARKWALSRNPAYYDFQSIGGDCTNFASQCLYAGSGIMNYTPVTGWFYRTASDRTPSWTAVEYLYKFLVGNKSVGPYASVVSRFEVQPGDIVQLADSSGMFYHSPVITAVYPTILVSTHTFDALDRPLYTYSYSTARFLHIKGVRIW